MNHLFEESMSGLSDQVPNSAPVSNIGRQQRFLKKGKKTFSPSSQPSSLPTPQPSPLPSVSVSPTSSPSDSPSVSSEPSSVPSSIPSSSPSACVDEPYWTFGGTSTIYANITCADIKSDVTNDWCDLLDSLYDESFGRKRISEACCDCGGGKHQTPTPSSIPSSNPSTSQAPSHAHFPSETPSFQPSFCRDEPGWTFTDEYGHTLGCDALTANTKKLCSTVGSIEFESKLASLACCVS